MTPNPKVIPLPSNRTIILLVFAAVAIANAWFRGPVFGLLPFYIFTLPFAAGLAFLLIKLKLDRRLKAALAVAGAVGISYWFCAPPSTSRLFHDSFNMDVPLELRNLQRWNANWARDPAYFMRFEADAATIDRLVSSGKCTENAVDEYQLLQFWRHFLGAPKWWKPEELSSPICWSPGGADDGGNFVFLYYDPDSHVAYLQVITW